MPIQIEDYQSRSAMSELGKAAGYGLSYGLATQAGWKVMELGAKGLWQVPKTAFRIANALPIKGAVGRVAVRGSGRLLSSAIPFAKDIAGGASYGAFKGASWMYNNPVASIGLIGGVGFGISMLDPTERMNNQVSASPSIVEAMGGSSQYGVRQMMSMMNADGSMVFGMNARR